MGKTIVLLRDRKIYCLGNTLSEKRKILARNSFKRTLIYILPLKKMFSFSRPIQISFGKSKVGSAAVIQLFILKFPIFKSCCSLCLSRGPGVASG